MVVSIVRLATTVEGVETLFPVSTSIKSCRVGAEPAEHAVPSEPSCQFNTTGHPAFVLPTGEVSWGTLKNLVIVKQNPYDGANWIHTVKYSGVGMAPSSPL